MKKLLFILLFTISLFHTSLFSQWIQQTVPVSKPITGIKFVDANTGWACTSWGTEMDTSYILHTSNGGTNWLVQHAAPNSRYNALSVIDANNIYAGGDSSARAKFSKTTNGGLSWIDIQTPVNMSIEDMVFQNIDSGWSCSGVVGPDVRTTTNGGLNWTVRTNGITQQTQRLFFLNYSTGFCGANSFLYKTTNAGLNWVLNNSFSESVASIFFINQATGWLGLTGGKVALTSNGGANWFIQQPFPLNGNTTTDINFININTGYAGTGWFQKILKTTNGGINWGYQLVPTGSVKISIVDSLNCWASDLGISHTTNGGGGITYVGLSNISVEIPSSSKLHQNYPNPFNPVTNFQIDISENTFVNITIYDILGKIIKTELEEFLKAGTYRVYFNASNLPSGIYFYRLTTNKLTATKKMILMK